MSNTRNNNISSGMQHDTQKDDGAHNDNPEAHTHTLVIIET